MPALVAAVRERDAEIERLHSGIADAVKRLRSREAGFAAEDGGPSACDLIDEIAASLDRLINPEGT